MAIGERAQTLCGFLGGEVALGFREELVADHELANGRRSQKRRVEVGMELPVVGASSPNGAWCQPIE